LKIFFLQKQLKMKTTRNGRDNLLTLPVHSSDQPKTGPSASRHLIRQAKLTEMTVSQLGGGLSNSRPVTIGNPNMKENNAGPPLSSLLKRNFTEEELQEKINKYTAKLKAYADNKTGRATKGKQMACFDDSLKACQKKVSRHHQKILEQMLMIMEWCNAKGFVYGMVTKTSKPMTGASDSLRAWWKDDVVFDKAAPIQIEQYFNENSLSSIAAQDSEAKSTTELLMALSDPTLGSILSLIMQHCDPPQRKFPFEKGLPPPWWPTAREGWWNQTSISTNEGAPPFRKPHDLKKRWKVAVIVGILKLMSPNFSRPYSIVEQSRYMQSRMNAKERKFWDLALVAEAKQYCQEHPNKSADEAVEFLHACGSSSSHTAPKVDRQSISFPRNEAPSFSSPFGVVHQPLIAPPSTITSAWPITVPPRVQSQRGIQESRTAHEPHLAMSGGFDPQFSPWAFSYNNPILSANVPMDVQQNHTIRGLVASNNAMQEHHTRAIPHPAFVELENPGGAPSMGGAQDVQNNVHGFEANMGFYIEPTFGNWNSESYR
jgi:Ethylene insensitive 3